MNAFKTTAELRGHIERREEVLSVLKENLSQLKGRPEKFAELEDLIKRRETTIKLQREQLRRREAEDGQDNNYAGSGDYGWGD